MSLPLLVPVASAGLSDSTQGMSKYQMRMAKFRDASQESTLSNLPQVFPKKDQVRYLESMLKTASARSECVERPQSQSGGYPQKKDATYIEKMMKTSSARVPSAVLFPKKNDVHYLEEMLKRASAKREQSTLQHSSSTPQLGQSAAQAYYDLI